MMRPAPPGVCRIPEVDRMRRAFTVAWAAIALAVVGTAALPLPVFACKCAPTPIGALDPATSQVYVGTAAETVAAGTPMVVELWFEGPGEAPLTYLAPSSFGDSASCGIDPLAPGSRWIMSTFVAEPGATPTTGMCQPHAQLETPDGQAMLAQAEAAYGPGSQPEGGGGGDAVAPDDLTPFLTLGGIVGLAILGLVVILLLRRGRPPEG
jgi:hypothetical protein